MVEEAQTEKIMKLRVLLIPIIAYAGYKLYQSQSHEPGLRDLIRQVKVQYSFLDYVPAGLVLGVIEAESNFKPDVTGSSGEYGLMQILPSTFSWTFGQYQLGTPLNPYDPFANILGGMLYLDLLYNILEDWNAVIHAYNVGPGGYAKGRRNEPYYRKVLKGWALA